MMKGVECKVPIQEDHRGFLDKPKIVAYSGSKKIAIISGVLLLIAMSLMIVFTLQSINGISELRKEVDYLKDSIKVLQEKIETNRYETDNPRNTIKLPELDKKDEYTDIDDVYPDYDYEQGEYDSYETYNEEVPDSDLLAGENYTKDAKEATAPPRTKRSIIGYTQDGTPINSQEYDTKHRKSYSTVPPPSSYATYGLYRELKNRNDGHSTPMPLQLRSRRLHVFPDEDQNFGHVVKAASLVKAGDSQNSQENPDVEFTSTTDEQFSLHPRHRQRHVELDEHHVRTGRIRPLPAAHFSGDTSKYVMGQHDNFKGNGHLRHPERTFIDWTESSWVHTLGMDRHFSLNEGFLTIKESGLYFIYAQIYYYDEHDINGFRVYRNGTETLLQCTTTTHSVDRIMKGNTCFTAGAEYLNENDKISLGDLSESRYSLFEPGKSFFGIIKLGDVKIK